MVWEWALWLQSPHIILKQRVDKVDWTVAGEGGQEGEEERLGFSRRIWEAIYVSEKQEVTSSLSLSPRLTLGSVSHGWDSWSPSYDLHDLLN